MKLCNALLLLVLAGLLAGCANLRPTSPTFTPVQPAPDITKFSEVK